MNTKFEQQKFKNDYSIIIGCDEVGRGSLAGPVVAAAVAAVSDSFNLKSNISNLKSIKDSKKLSAKKREELASFIKQNFLWGIGEVGAEVVDEINIHKATLLAMEKAVKNLLKKIPVPSETIFLYIDGKFTPAGLQLDRQAVVGGDNKIFSVAAASIVAKVYRDGLMTKLDKKFPQYGFARHKGYGTLHHRQMIIKNGLSFLHRKSFCKKLM